MSQLNIDREQAGVTTNSEMLRLAIGALSRITWLLLICIPLTTTVLSQVLAVEHVSVISMDSPELQRDQTVVVSGGRIVSVTGSQKAKIPNHARRIDGRGKYLMPGLADMHVHLQSPIELQLFLAYGVTTAFDLNGKAPYLLWRSQINSGKMLGPQLFLCGPYFRDPEPVDSAVRRVDEIAAQGYDAIKIKNNVTTEEFDAIVAEAKRKGLLLMGHTPRKPGLYHAIDAGMSLAHEEEILYGAFSPAGDGTVVPDNAKAQVVAARIKAAGVYVTPNLVMYDHIYRQATDYESFARLPEFRYMSPWGLDRFHSQNPYKSRPSKQQEEFRTNLEFMKRVLTPALRTAGAPMLAGTDAEDLGTLAGVSLIEELQILEEVGLTPYEALQTATTNAARYLRRENDFGRVRPSMRADLILLDRNPLQTTKNLNSLAGVFVRGKWLPREKLESVKRGLGSQYQEELRRLRGQLSDGNYEAAFELLRFNDPYQRVGPYLLTTFLREGGFDKLVLLVSRLRIKYPDSVLSSESAINSLGYSIMGDSKLDEAIRLFKWNTESFPQSSNAQDSLAEAFDRRKDIPSAMAAYSKALDIDPNYANAKAAREYLQAHRLLQEAVLERTVVKNELISKRLPQVTLKFPDDLKYVGGQAFNFYGVAHAEEHFFVDADKNGIIQRMYLVQFESFLRGTSDAYDYKTPDKLIMGNLEFLVDTRVRPVTHPSPDSDAGHAIAFLEGKGLHFADENLRARFIHLPDATKRNELMILYQENLAPTGLRAADLSAGGAKADKWPDMAGALIARASKGVVIK